MKYSMQISGAIATMLLVSSMCTKANAEPTLNIPLGTEFDELGHQSTPNSECQSPESISLLENGNWAVLDSVNNRILNQSVQGVSWVPIPSTTASAIDFISTPEVFISLSADAELIVFDRSGNKILSRPLGNQLASPGLSLSVSPEGELFVTTATGEVVSTSLNIGAVNTIAPKVPLTDAIEVTSELRSEFTAVLPSGDTVTHSSSGTIESVEVLSVGSNAQAVLLVEETMQLPRSVTFTYLLKMTAGEDAYEISYKPPNSGGCNSNIQARVDGNGVPYWLLLGSSELNIAPAEFGSVQDVSPPDRDSISADIVPVASNNDVFSALERLNGVNSIDAVSGGVPSMTREQILERARSALSHQWELHAVNYATADIASSCSPRQGDRWRRPKYLSDKIGDTITSIPYRWGGFHRSTTGFDEDLDENKLAGDVCTCRQSQYDWCITYNSTGLDCSGFVSLAWRIGYHTTVALDKVSTATRWKDVRPGDILLRAGSHVMLVSSVDRTGNNTSFNVIHASVSCGRVCEQSFSQADLIRDGYNPRTRNSLTP